MAALESHIGTEHAAEKTANLVLGTAGHIDHGKSSLVCALTGVNPDRLEEERRRGITIELGFARLDLPDGTSLGVVDVPGHEKFVRQMIAGATGIDLALLCIAADDGIMPQTEEHLTVLQLLGIRRVVVALTKIDIVDEEWISLVRLDIQERLNATPFAGAPIVAVSSRTGEGLEELKQVLQDQARFVQTKSPKGPLRLPIDRSFTIKGAGTVVTGTLWSGIAKVGEKVSILPGEATARIRGIQMHGAPAEEAYPGHRVALNLSGVSTDEVRPGDFVTAPNVLRPTFRFDCDFTYIDVNGRWGKPLENGVRVHVSHGAKEVLGRLYFLGERTTLESGNRCFAQIRLEEPLPVLWQDCFIVRSYSPVNVIGGGMVLRAHPKRSTALNVDEAALLEALRGKDAFAAVASALAASPYPVDAVTLADRLGAYPDLMSEALTALACENRAVVLNEDGGRPSYIAPDALARLLESIDDHLRAFHAENPTETGMAKDALRRRVAPKIDAAVFEFVLALAVSAGKVELADGKVTHPQMGIAAKNLLSGIADKLFEALEAGAATPRTGYQLIMDAGLEQGMGYRALAMLERDGRAVKAGAEYWFSASVVQRCQDAVVRRLSSGPASSAELRDAMESNRNCAIALLEYFDSRGITRRDGNERVLA